MYFILDFIILFKKVKRSIIKFLQKDKREKVCAEYQFKFLPPAGYDLTCVCLFVCFISSGLLKNSEQSFDGTWWRDGALEMIC